MKTLRLLIPALALAVASPVMAADVNTYRPGKVYAASPMPSADVCALQCSGTAQCYGWNFLRSGNPDGSGICELNASSAAAVGHPYAVSGDNGGRSYGASNVVQGQSRTFRIGNPQAARPVTMPAKAASPRIHTGNASVQNARIQNAPMRRPATNAPVIRKRTFAPAAQAAASRPQAVRPRQPQAPAPQMTLTQQQALQMAAKTRRPTAPQMRPQMQQAGSPRVHPASTPRTQPGATPQSPYNRPQAAPHNQSGYPKAAPARPIQAAPAPRPNLYGSLYDAPVAQGPSSGQAVSALGRRIARAKAGQAKASPKSVTPPLYADRPASAPDAPIATAAPVKAIKRSGLEMAGPSPQ